MELGADAVLMNSGIAHAEDPVLMAEAMKHGVIAGRQAYLAGRCRGSSMQLPAHLSTVSFASGTR